jgi:hypothetical protein
MNIHRRKIKNKGEQRIEMDKEMEDRRTEQTKKPVNNRRKRGVK